ncbi:MAG: epoxyqueuosine reductase [Eubacteriaceae bacterium]|nr:epoxyqueuosine reductase [Eubacteriaceae bacterium]
MNDLTERLYTLLKSEGAAIAQAGSLLEVAPEERRGMPVGVSIACAFEPHVIRGIQDGPTLEYFAHYQKLNDMLDSLAEQGAEFLKSEGYSAIAMTRAETAAVSAALTTPLPHKTVATRAGVGFIGKCALLITRQYGSAIRLISILTNAPVDLSEPINKSYCGKCMDCASVCPGSAPTGQNWALGKERSSFFNAGACQKAASAQAAAIGVNYTLCGKCIAACMYTRKYLKYS